MAAPAVVMPDVSGAAFALGEKRGQWVVLHLYPRSDTPDCACDATAFTEHLWRFGSLATEVVCVTSETAEEAARFAKKYGLTVTLLPDPLCTVAKAVGAFDAASADPVVRTTLVITPDGNIAARWDRVTDPEHIEDVLRVLEGLGQREPGQD